MVRGNIFLCTVLMLLAKVGGKGSVKRLCHKNYKLVELLSDENERELKLYKAQVDGAKANEFVMIKVERVGSRPQLAMNEFDILDAVSDHANTIDLICTQKGRKHAYIVYEYCDSQDLWFQVMSNGPLAEEKVWGYLKQLVDVLSFLREKRIAHRDLKSDSILLTNGGKTIKLTDFDKAVQVPLNKKMKTVVGTPLYMSPERLSAEAYNLDSDLWSVGTLLYELLTGTTLFETVDGETVDDGTNRDQVFKSMRKYFDIYEQVRLTDLDDVVVSHEMSELVRRLLQPDPEDRIPFDDFQYIVEQHKEKRPCFFSSCPPK